MPIQFLDETQPDPQLYAFYGDAGVGKTRLVAQATKVYGKTLYINKLGGPQSIVDRAVLKANGLLEEAEITRIEDVLQITSGWCDEHKFEAVVFDKYSAEISENVLTKLKGASDTRAVYGDNMRECLRGLSHLQTLRRPVFLVLGEDYDKDEIGAMWWFPDLPGQLKYKFTEYVSLLARITVKENSKGDSVRRVQMQRAGTNVEARTREPTGKIPPFYEAQDLELGAVMRAAGL